MASSRIIKKESASNIAKQRLHKYANIKHFLNTLVKDVDIEIEQVGKTYSYPPGVITNHIYGYYNQFIYFFIRKHLSNQFNIKLTDDITKLVVENPNVYLNGMAEKYQKLLTNDYAIFMDMQQNAMDIIESIKLVSLTYAIFYHNPLPNAEIDSNTDSLREVINYFEKLPYSKVDMRSNVNCEYFEGYADLIFDEKVLYEIKTSKFKFLKPNDQKIDVKNFFKMLLYGFGFYRKTKKIIKCFKIYNPLLGMEYTLRLDDIDMELFEEVLKKDLNI